MTKPEEMVMKTVRDLGAAGLSDVCNYAWLSPASAGLALGSLYRNGYLKVVSVECKYHEEEGIEMVYCPNMIGGWVEMNGSVLTVSGKKVMTDG